MAQTELLTVEQVFQRQGIGLTIMPDFLVPQGGWKHSTQQALGRSMKGALRFFQKNDLGRCEVDERPRPAVMHTEGGLLRP